MTTPTVTGMRLLGIDPGLQRTGWGVITVDGNRLRPVAAGVLRSTASRSLAERLAELHAGLTDVIATWAPTEAAVEETFVNKNPLSTLKLGQARGIALLVPALAGLPVHEYATNAVKSAVVGAGHAGKEQVAMMVQRLLPGLATDIAADASDALAVAICHAHHAQTRRLWSPPLPSPLRGEGQGEGATVRGKRRPRKPLDGETKFARQLRADPTELEKLMWLKLRNREFDGWKFRRQVPIVGYVADFACLEAGLIIELDGTQHAQTVERDERRTIVLNQAGFRVLRFWNSQLMEDFPAVIATIKDALGTPSPQPSPRGGEGR